MATAQPKNSGSDTATRSPFVPPTAADIQSMSAREALELIVDRSPTIMKQLKKIHALPDGVKTVRTFRSGEAAKLIGRSQAWLRDAENNGALGERPGRDDSGAWRTYTLDDINALREIAGTRPRRPEGQATQVIAMLNFKGGASKTTTTHLFSHYLAMTGYRVLLVDLDPQGSLTASFEIRNAAGKRREEFDWEDSIGPILTGEREDLVPLIQRTHWPTIDIVPAAIDSYDAELTIAVDTARGGMTHGDEFWLRLDRALSAVDGYDVILIDSAPALSFGLVNAYMAATGVVVPTPARVVDIKAMQKFAMFVLRWIEKMEAVAPSREKWLRILISQYSRGSVTEQTNSQVSRANLGSLILEAPMANAEAIKRGVGGVPSPYEGSSADVSKATSAHARVREQLEEPFREMLALLEAGWGITTRTKA